MYATKNYREEVLQEGAKKCPQTKDKCKRQKILYSPQSMHLSIRLASAICIFYYLFMMYMASTSEEIREITINVGLPNSLCVGKLMKPLKIPGLTTH